MDLDVFLVIFLANISSFGYSFDWDSSIDNSETRLDKFVLNQFYENCFGPEEYKRMKSIQTNATNLCKTPASTTPSTPSHSHPPSLQMKFPTIRSGWPGYPADVLPLAIFQLRNKSFFRSKRNLETRLDKIKQKMATKIQKISCIIHKSGITNDDRSINIAGLINAVESVSLDQNLKSDLKQSIEVCGKVVKCFSESNVDNNAMGEHTEAIEFINCYEKKKKEACVKKSIREKLIAQLKENMSLEEIQNILSRGSANSPQYYASFPDFENIVHTIFITDYQ